MNYSPNTTQWQIGDIVLHDADAKEPHMFMRVVGFTRDGLVKTKYVQTIVRGKKRRIRVYENELKYLHDVHRFGFNPDGSETE